MKNSFINKFYYFNLFYLYSFMTIPINNIKFIYLLFYYRQNMTCFFFYYKKKTKNIYYTYIYLEHFLNKTLYIP